MCRLYVYTDLPVDKILKVIYKGSPNDAPGYVIARFTSLALINVEANDPVSTALNQPTRN